uniref:Reverse transcriptase domain-containing protein n=1 Tax=Amphimedon queenslandica TaxID=400682 RepID=A0A1X7V6V3_AMPQE
MFRRLPFGISTAPEFFQKMGEILCDCKGIVGLIDDVLVYGKTEEEHKLPLTAVLEKLEEKGVTLNKDKCIFYSDSIQFLSQTVNQGVSPGQGKLLQEMSLVGQMYLR